MHDIVIIGAGVIGGAIAFELSKYNLDVLVLERDNDISCGTSRANSGIVHAGYDPKCGSLMAKLNVSGSQLMEQVCRDLAVSYKRCGSLVLAFEDEQTDILKKLYERGVDNGVTDLSIIERDEILAFEPNINPNVLQALYAPTAAIVSPWELTIAYLETAVRNGVKVKLNQEVCGIKKENDCFRVTTKDSEYTTRLVINCAGVYADVIHNMVSPPKYKIIPDKGEYYLLDKNQGGTVSHVIFQTPSSIGKGVLVSPTSHGNLIVGPSSEVIADKEDTSTTREKLSNVMELARLSVPNVSFRDNIRNFAGVRSNTDTDDFYIQEDDNIKGFIDVFGIKSPGLSSAPAIGLYVTDIVSKSPPLNKRLTKNANAFTTRERIIFRELSDEQKNQLIKQDPNYGVVICRCETITKGEILAAIRSPIPPVSVDGIKRRCHTGTGRCQGGFCAPRIVEILAEELGIDKTQVLMDRANSYILTGKTKSGVTNEG